MTIAGFYPPSTWDYTGATAQVTGVSWAAGDEVIVVGLLANSNDGLATPTATGLTFNLVTSIDANSAAEAAAYLWRATAGSGGSSVTISSTHTGSNRAGVMAWVRTGTAPTTITLTGTNTEAAYSQACPAGSDVIVAWTDWNAVAAGFTGTTGSGTLTERVDTQVASQYTNWAADWQDVTSGTFTWGTTSYTGLIVAQVGIVLAPATGGHVTTPYIMDGFEHGVTGAGVTSGTGICSAQAGTWTITTSNPRGAGAGGARSLRVNPSAATGYWRWSPANTTRHVIRFGLRFNSSLPAATTTFLTLSQNTSSDMTLRYNSGSQKLEIGASSWTASTNTVSADTWYLIEIDNNLTANPNTYSWRIDGTAQTQNTQAVAADTCWQITLGCGAASTCDIQIDDFILTNTGSDYPIGDGYIVGLSPTGVGTHSFTANDFSWSSDGGSGWTNISSTSDDQSAKIGQLPMSGSTNRLRQTVIRTTGYLEHTFADLPANAASVKAARGYVSYISTSTTANQGATGAYRSSDSTFLPIYGNPTTRGDMSETSVFYKSANLALIGNTTTEVNGLTSRIGYSGDVTPNPHWLSTQLQVEITVSGDVTVTPTVAAATGAGVAAIGAVAPVPTQSAGTAAGIAPTVTKQNTVTMTAAGATAVGIAPAPLVTRVPTQANAVGVGVAPDVSTATPPVTVTPTVAAATGAAVAPVPAVARVPSQADAAAVGVQPAPLVARIPTQANAAAVGVAPDATTAKIVVPTVANATGAAQSPAGAGAPSQSLMSNIGTEGAPVQTITSGTFTPPANSTLIVFGYAMRWNHNATTNWAVSDTGSLGGWETLVTGQDTGGNYGGTGAVFATTVGGSPPSNMTVTIDPWSTTDTGILGVTVWAVTGAADEWLAQSNALAAYATSPLAPTLSSTPSSLCLAGFWVQNNVVTTFGAVEGGWSSAGTDSMTNAGDSAVMAVYRAGGGDATISQTISSTADSTFIAMLVEVAGAAVGGVIVKSFPSQANAVGVGVAPEIPGQPVTVVPTVANAAAVGVAPSSVVVSPVPTQANAAATGVAPVPVVARVPSQANAAAVGVQPVPLVARVPSQANATGVGQQPGETLIVTPTVAAATGAAVAPTVSKLNTVVPTQANATAAGVQAVPLVALVPAQADAVGVGQQPTVFTAGFVAPLVANATATGVQPVSTVTFTATQADAVGVGVAPVAVATRFVTPEVAAASGAALDTSRATVTFTATQANVSAVGVAPIAGPVLAPASAAGTGAAAAPSATVAPVPVVATAAAIGAGLSGETLIVTPGVAAASGVGVQPAASTAKLVEPTVAAAQGAAADVTSSSRASGVVAGASAHASDVTVTIDTTATVAASAGAAVAPALLTTIVGDVAPASGDAWTVDVTAGSSRNATPHLAGATGSAAAPKRVVVVIPLPAAATASAGLVGLVVVNPPLPGSWWQWAQARSAPDVPSLDRVACPRCGGRLSQNPGGELSCSYDGWRPEAPIRRVRVWSPRDDDRWVEVEGEQSCPSCGEPLSAGPDGALFCRFDGWSAQRRTAGWRTARDGGWRREPQAEAMGWRWGDDTDTPAWVDP